MTSLVETLTMYVDVRAVPLTVMLSHRAMQGSTARASTRTDLRLSARLVMGWPQRLKAYVWIAGVARHQPGGVAEASECTRGSAHNRQ